MDECSMKTCYGMPRKRGDGIVLQSNRTVWRICEDDILEIAKGRGLELTESQLETVAEYVSDGLSAVCDWASVVDMALDEVRDASNGSS